MKNCGNKVIGFLRERGRGIKTERGPINKGGRNNRNPPPDPPPGCLTGRICIEIGKKHKEKIGTQRSNGPENRKISGAKLIGFLFKVLLKRTKNQSIIDHPLGREGGENKNRRGGD